MNPDDINPSMVPPAGRAGCRYSRTSEKGGMWVDGIEGGRLPNEPRTHYSVLMVHPS
jgi:hypothetical protein